jgi:cytoplasmic iron level regulating protein YaaA (DUF328/UPF0246 family)
MIIVLSPAKTLDFETPNAVSECTQPLFLDDSRRLIEALRKLSAPRIAELMGISERLSILNRERYAAWTTPFTPDNARQALLAFNGDVYEGMAAQGFTAADRRFAQRSLRILSGLYGVLRPLDLIQPYRLEMSIPLATRRGKDLYAFWGERLTDAINAAIVEERAPELVNLASQEYFKAIRVKKLVAPVIEPVFEDYGGGRYRVVSFHAKRARGLMARFAVVERVRKAAGLKNFSEAGYRFDAGASGETRWVFRRRSE